MPSENDARGTLDVPGRHQRTKSNASNASLQSVSDVSTRSGRSRRGSRPRANSDASSRSNASGRSHKSSSSRPRAMSIGRDRAQTRSVGHFLLKTLMPIESMINDQIQVKATQQRRRIAGYEVTSPKPGDQLTAKGRPAKGINADETDAELKHFEFYANPDLDSFEKLDLPELKSRHAILIGGYAVFFLRYVVATFLSAFFGPFATTAGISDSMQGMIFAVFPTGIAITASVAPKMILRMGTRKAVFYGMFGTAFFTLLMGFVPMMWKAAGWSSASTVWGYAILYFLNGFIGGLAETGTTIVLTNKFADRLAAVTASIGTVAGVGCLAGPPLGGVLYNLPSEANGDTPEHDHWSFACPFITVAAATFVLSVYIYMNFSNVEQSGDKTKSSWENYKLICTPARVLTLFALTFSGAIVASLDPTLSNHLEPSPYNMNASKVGTVFMISSIAYIITSIPVGWGIDNASGENVSIQRATRLCKLIQAGGFLFLFFCFALLGPLDTASGRPDARLQTPAVVWFAMIIKGIGSSGNNGGYPDLLIGIDDNDSSVQATVAGIWNAAYAFGWAAGPLMGGILVQSMGFSGYCTVTAYLSLAFGGALVLGAYVTEPSSIPLPGDQPGGEDGSDDELVGEDEDDALLAYDAGGNGAASPYEVDDDGHDASMMGGYTNGHGVSPYEAEEGDDDDDDDGYGNGNGGFNSAFGSSRA